jgi:DNA-directed RNA polymerase beta subunit
MTQIICFEKEPTYSDLANAVETLTKENDRLQAIIKDMIDGKLPCFIHNGYFVCADNEEVIIVRSEGEMEVSISHEKIKISLVNPENNA